MPKLNFPSSNLCQELAKRDSEPHSKLKDLNYLDEQLLYKIILKLQIIKIINYFFIYLIYRAFLFIISCIK